MELDRRGCGTSGALSQAEIILKIGVSLYRAHEG